MTKIVLCIIFFSAMFCETAFAEKKLRAKSYLGKKPPDILLEGFISEAPEMNNEQFHLIEFWEPWCGSCKKTIPLLNSFHKKFHDKLVVLGISSESKEETLAMKSPKIEYYSAFDTKRKTSLEMGILSVPHIIILNPDGIVVWEGSPLLEGYELTEEVIKDLLNIDDNSSPPQK